MAETSTPVEIFCCYSHADELWLRKLETHLSLLQRQGLISLWHDRLIPPGTDWAKTIDTHLETASVILLLVSADFLASDYCYSIEMKRALERHAANEARVVPILVRPVDWTNAPFAHLQALPTDAKPIASWRSKERALVDVTSGIRRTIEDVPLLAASAPRAALPTTWNIPYPRNPFFLGRETELLQVRRHLHTGEATALSQPQAISGLGGIGKTQLALEYAYRYHQDYQAVLWAGAESTEALVSSYVSIASLLRLPEREAKEQDITVRAVKTWLLNHRGWLLILDNADELTLLPDFLPPSLGGHLLLTTRAAATGRLAHRLEIETLLPEQGALFLLRRSGLIAPDAPLEQALLQERELVLQISQELGGLPLALDQAGAYLEETGTNLSSYWQIYQQHRADLLQQRGGRVADHPAPVATTWSLSFGRVEEKNPAAADLLKMSAFLSPDAIPEEILAAGASLLGPVLPT
jgi:TIR domain/NB-ARC domain